MWAMLNNRSLTGALYVTGAPFDWDEHGFRPLSLAAVWNGNFSTFDVDDIDNRNGFAIDCNGPIPRLDLRPAIADAAICHEGTSPIVQWRVMALVCPALLFPLTTCGLVAAWPLLITGTAGQPVSPKPDPGRATPEPFRPPELRHQSAHIRYLRASGGTRRNWSSCRSVLRLL